MSYVEKLVKEMNTQKYDEEYINLCANYAENLVRLDLPVIFDGRHFAALLGVKFSTLSYYISQNDLFYNKYKIKKKTGGFRAIDAPTLNLKKIQSWILENILEKIPLSESSFGFRQNRSIADNAEKHTHKEIVYNVDIKNFFPSILIEDIFYIFYNRGYTYELSYIFSKLVVHNNHLPQGAPTSPYLSNIKCLKLDQSFELYCKNIDATYSRYADDITISTNNSDLLIKNLKEVSRKIIGKHGFKVNFKKERVQLSNQMQEVTGLIVNNGVKVKRKYKKEIEKEIYFCKKYGVNSHLNKSNRNNVFFYKEYMYGKVNFINSIEPDIAKEYYEQLDDIDWGM